MSKPRWFTALAALTGACVLIAAGASAVGAKTKGKADSGKSYTSVTHAANGSQFLAGNNSDKILGEGAIALQVTVAPTGTPGTFKVTAKKVTLFTRTGSLTGTGSATLVIVGTAETLSNGKLSLTKGAGSQRHHSLVGTFQGSGSTATNQTLITYKGTYK